MRRFFCVLLSAILLTAGLAALTDGEGRTEAAQPQRGSHGQQPFSLTNLLYTVATWFSILFLFAAATHGVEYLIAGKRKVPASA